MNQAELEFLAELQAAEQECRKLGYNPTAFVGMLGRSGPFDVVRTLLQKPNPSDGFARLFMLGRPDLTVEAIALRPQWQKYFSEAELAVARSRLGQPHSTGTAPKDRPAPAGGDDVEQLLGQLAAANANADRTAAKRIRWRLRELGHYGGISLPPEPPDPPSPPVLPPIPEAESLLARIRALNGLAERNHERVVEDLLTRLGFDVSRIVFQRGRIDVCIVGPDNKAAAVFEVKTSIQNSAQHAEARRQGFDYANQSKARFVILTDGDRYEVYDRRKGLDYDEMFAGKFQLTAFRETDSAALDLIRPSSLIP